MRKSLAIRSRIEATHPSVACGLTERRIDWEKNSDHALLTMADTSHQLDVRVRCKWVTLLTGLADNVP